MALTIDQLNIQIAANSSQASRALTTLISKLEKLKATLGGANMSNITISNSFNKVTNTTNKATNAQNQYNNATQRSARTTRSFSDTLAYNITKFRTLFGVFRSLARVMGDWFNESNDYIEMLNLFNVTMGDAADGAREYANKVSEAMGIDPAEWMQNQGVFKNLVAGFGVAQDAANTMSQNLTQLSYDMASFFNTDVETAFDKLSSAMAGQVKGLREFGIDTTVASLQEYALAKGIDKKVRSMTQAEKSMLRYNYIMEKSIIMQGDMARTLVTPANALRILSAQFTLLKRALGNIISTVVTKFIPYVQAMVEIIRDAANSIATLFGFEIPEIDYSGLDSTGMTDDMEEGLEDVSKTAKKLKKQLMGFDELNIITNPSSGDSDSDSGGGSLNMAPLEYDFLKGLEPTKLDEIKQKIKDIWEIAKWVGIAIVGWKLGSFISSLVTANMMATTLKGSLAILGTKLVIAVGVTLLITGVLLEAKGIISAIKEGLNKINFAEIVGGALLTTGGAAILGKAIVTFIGKVGSTKVAFALARLGMNLGVGTTGALGAAMGAAFAGIIAGIPMFITGIYDAIKNGLDWLSGVLIPAGATMAGAGIGAIIGMLGGPIGAGIGALIGLAVGLVTDLVILIVQNWDNITSWCSQACTNIGQFFVDLWNGIVGVWNTVAEWFNTWVIIPVVNFFSNLWTSVSGFFVNLWNDIVSIWNTVVEWFNTCVITPLVNFFVGLWTWISTAASDCWNAIVEFFTPAVEWFGVIFYDIGVLVTGCWEIIKAAWGIASAWFDTEVIQPTKDFFQKLWEDISGFFISLWEDIKEIWQKVSTWFNTEVVQPVKEFFVNLWTVIKEAASSAWNGIKNVAITSWEGIKSVFSTIGNWINEKVIQPVGKFFSNLWDGFKEGAKKAWEGVKSVFSVVGTFFKETFESAWKGIVKVFSIAGDIFVDIKDGIVEAFKLIVNGIIYGINNTIYVPFAGINKALSWLRDLEILNIQPFKNLKTITIPQIPLLASGGIVSEGQMFIAREAGPELVGQIGNKTAVANNDQIVSGIEAGVYRAMMAANSGNGGNVTVHATFEMDGEVIGRKVIKYHNGVVLQTGESPLLV